MSKLVSENQNLLPLAQGGFRRYCSTNQQITTLSQGNGDCFDKREREKKLQFLLILRMLTILIRGWNLWACYKLLGVKRRIL